MWNLELKSKEKRQTIVLTDTGGDTDDVWTLQHKYDETLGPLVLSQVRDVLKAFQRYSPAPVRLIALQEEIDKCGKPTGKMVPYLYYWDGITVMQVANT